MSTTHTEALLSNIRAEMARRGMNQTALATELGVTQSTISKWLRGASPIDINELYRLADVLQVSVVSLLPAETVAAS